MKKSFEIGEIVRINDIDFVVLDNPPAAHS